MKKGESAPTFIEKEGEVLPAQTGPNAPNFSRVDTRENRAELAEEHGEITAQTSFENTVDEPTQPDAGKVSKEQVERNLRGIKAARSMVALRPGEIRTSRRTDRQERKLAEQRDEAIHRAVAPRPRRPRAPNTRRR